jgi:phosphopantetheine adenylyltransferase
MKGFTSFIHEARSSRATEIAKARGFESDGHGNWVDGVGKIRGRTVNGEFVLVTPKSPQKVEPPPAPRRLPKPQPIAQPKIKAVDRPGPQKAKQVEPIKEPKSAKTVTVVFGRFNPPSKGHQKLLDKAAEIASDGDFFIYPSRAQDNSKNPLEPNSKIRFMERIFPEYKKQIKDNPDIVSIFDALVAFSEDNYKVVNIVTGANKMSEFDRLATQYNGKMYDFDEINVIPSDSTDPDYTEGSDSSKMRKAALEDDFQTFKVSLPTGVSPKDAQSLFQAVQRAYGSNIKETWQVAPRMDIKELREQYYQDKIFQVGSIVENLNTGLIGTVKRRGPNYLICVTEDNIMFKSWIQDLTEWTNQSGVPSNQREVGTFKLTKYVADLMGAKDFLKKYKKSLQPK